jgi:hypothetical protein
MRRFFAPDKKKCGAFLRAQKNVAEKNRTKGASPTGVLCSLAAYWRRTVTVLLCAGFRALFIFLLFSILNIFPYMFFYFPIL